MDVFGILIISLLSGIGSISGISGGAITVPFALLTLGFVPKEATAFSNIIAFFLSFIKSVLCFYKTDPDKKSKTLIGKPHFRINKRIQLDFDSQSNDGVCKCDRIGS